MKIKLNVTFGLPAPNTDVELDGMARSYLVHNGTKHGGPEARFRMPEWHDGDQFGLQIPSGTFEGTVYAVRTYDGSDSAEAVSFASVFGGPQPAPDGVRVYVDGEWNGKEGGLTAGLCAFGTFEPLFDRAQVTESSLLPAGKSVNYLTYKWAKDARLILGMDDEGAKMLLAQAIMINERPMDDAGRFNIYFSRKPLVEMNPFFGRDFPSALSSSVR